MGGAEQFGWRANPYLRWPVVLDEYVKNRDVWRCPSAKLTSGATFILPGPDFIGHLRAHEGAWGADIAPGFGICATSWPPGWGGVITDSIAQQTLAQQWASSGSGQDAKDKVFSQSIAYNGMGVELKMVEVEDAARYVICSDGGPLSDAGSPGTIAYPDICCAECSGINWSAWGWPTYNADGSDLCPNSGGACPECWATHASLSWIKSPDLRRASTRHLGGSNLGFLDGHASWFLAERILTIASEDELGGIAPFCDGGTRAGYVAACGEPPVGAEFLY
jgi:prepilin-type processing-associated H-X9-DG protein